MKWNTKGWPRVIREVPLSDRKTADRNRSRSLVPAFKGVDPTDPILTKLFHFKKTQNNSDAVDKGPVMSISSSPAPGTSYGLRFLIPSSILLALALLTSITRLYTRCRPKCLLRWDDYTLVFALVRWIKSKASRTLIADRPLAAADRLVCHRHDIIFIRPWRCGLRTACLNCRPIGGYLWRPLVLVHEHGQDFNVSNDSTAERFETMEIPIMEPYRSPNRDDHFRYFYKPCLLPSIKCGMGAQPRCCVLGAVADGGVCIYV